MSALDNPQVDISLEAFLRNVRPRLKTLFVRYGIPPQDTEDILQQAKQRAHSLLEANRHLVEALRDALLERHELIGSEITDVLAGATPPAVVDLRDSEGVSS